MDVVVTIYGRKCSCEPDRIKYVGYTSDPNVGRYIRDKVSASRPTSTRPVEVWMYEHRAAGHTIEWISLESDVPYDLRGEVEKKWISLLGPDVLLNATLGGGGRLGSKHSEEARAKMSAAVKGKPKSPEHRAKIGAAQMGENNHRHGKKHTEEHLQFLRNRNSGSGNPMSGRAHSEESKKKISDTKKRRNAERREMDGQK